tara:strand:+ start:40 stop:231 length:192 start_codon:yes stop_codon:yes gene_type:complete
MELVLIFALMFSVFAGVSTHQKDIQNELKLQKLYNSSLQKPVIQEVALAQIDGVEVKNLERKG